MWPPVETGSPPLPYITAELPGVGGQLKAEPAHFVVEEIPLYEASGSGAHLYVSLTREGWTTPSRWPMPWPTCSASAGAMWALPA